MTKSELKARAETFRKLAQSATPGERTAYLKLARGYYSEAGLDGMARYIERFLG